MGKQVALRVAADDGDLAQARALLEQGCDVNENCPGCGFEGMTPLIISVLIGHVKLVRLFLDHGADMEIADNDGGTALMVSAQKGSMKIVRLLVGRGANVRTHADPSASVGTALIFAAGGGHLEVCRYLLANGAKAKDTNAWGKTAREEARRLFFRSNDNEAQVIQLLTEAENAEEAEEFEREGRDDGDDDDDGMPPLGGSAAAAADGDGDNADGDDDDDDEDYVRPVVNVIESAKQLYRERKAAYAAKKAAGIIVDTAASNPPI